MAEDPERGAHARRDPRRTPVRRLRDALVVAEFELRDSLRSRKALVLLVLYVAGAAAGTGIFVRVLGAIEDAVASSLAVAHTSRPGAMTQALFETRQFHRIVGRLVGDSALADELVRIPPIALFYGWLAMTFVPILVVLLGSDAVASDLATGAARYSLFRTDRLAFAAGKLVGQTALVAVGIAVGGVAAFAIGWIFLSGFDPGPTLVWMVRLGARAWVLAFAYVGLALGVSQLTRSTHWSRGLGLLALAALGAAGEALTSRFATEHVPVLASSLYVLLPKAHRLDLWRPLFWDRLPALAMLVALGIVFFAAGHARFARRDA